MDKIPPEANYEDLKCESIHLPSILEDIPRNTDHFAPLYEALTNSLEAIKSLGETNSPMKIQVEIRLKHQLFEDLFTLDSIQVRDTGCGIDDAGFDRFKRYRDGRKGFWNRGTGRIQFLHFAQSTVFNTVFKASDGLYGREFSLSTKTLAQEVLVSHHRVTHENSADATKIGTTVTFQELVDEKDQSIFSLITAEELALQIKQHYLLELSSFRTTFPVITVERTVDGSLVDEYHIDRDSIPAPDKTLSIAIPYERWDASACDFVQTGTLETVTASVFRFPPDKLRSNEVKVTTKGQIATNTCFVLASLPHNEIINGTHFYVALSSPYFDRIDGDARGTLPLKRKAQLRTELIDVDVWPDKDFLDLDRMESSVDSEMTKNYPEIADAVNHRKFEFDRLKRMFLLDDSTVNGLRFSPDDSEEEILKKVYAQDSKVMAKRDAEIKRQIDQITAIDPTSSDYLTVLKNLSQKVVSVIPLQNRMALTHQIARRKLVLELFEKALDRTLTMQGEGSRNIDEEILHNIVFQQHSMSPAESDLWLISEEYVYFKGASESRLSDIAIGGTKLLRDSLSDEEMKHLTSLNENRLTKRPDILLFPEEGKCIIIELKNPQVNVSDHLTELNRYAGLIYGLQKPEFGIRTFYGYLIGEGIDSIDVRTQDSDFIDAPSLHYLYRPHKRVFNPFSKLSGDGDIYTEVMSYRALLERAKVRNRMFIDCLMGSST